MIWAEIERASPRPGQVVITVIEVLIRNDTGRFSDVPLGLCGNDQNLQAFPAIELMKGAPEEDTSCVCSQRQVRSLAQVTEGPPA